MVNFEKTNVSDTSVENNVHSAFQGTWTKQDDDLSECDRGNRVDPVPLTGVCKITTKTSKESI